MCSGVCVSFKTGVCIHSTCCFQSRWVGAFQAYFCCFCAVIATCPSPFPSLSLALSSCVCVCVVLVSLGPLPSEPQCAGPHSSLAIEYECAVFRPWGDGARVTEKQRGSDSGGEGNLPPHPTFDLYQPLLSPTTSTFSPSALKLPLNYPSFLYLSLVPTFTSLLKTPLLLY